MYMQQEVKHAQLPFFNEYLPRQPEALQMSKNNSWNKSQSIWARKCEHAHIEALLLGITRYKHGENKQ